MYTEAFSGNAGDTIPQFPQPPNGVGLCGVFSKGLVSGYTAGSSSWLLAARALAAHAIDLHIQSLQHHP